MARDEEDDLYDEEFDFVDDDDEGGQSDQADDSDIVDEAETGDEPEMANERAGERQAREGGEANSATRTMSR